MQKSTSGAAIPDSSNQRQRSHDRLAPTVAGNIQTSASGHLKLHMTAVLMLRNPRELAELKTQLQQPDA